jgi:hypothetical protein
VRQLLPFPFDLVNPAALYRDLPPAGTPVTARLNMIASIDGATAVAVCPAGSGPGRPCVVRAARSLAGVLPGAVGTVQAKRCRLLRSDYSLSGARQ